MYNLYFIFVKCSIFSMSKIPSFRYIALSISSFFLFAYSLKIGRIESLSSS